MEFEPKKINIYTIDELKQFITSGTVSFTDMKQCGLNYLKREEIEKWLTGIKEEKTKIEAEFNAARSIYIVPAFEVFISKYEGNPMAAEEVTKARMYRDILIREKEEKERKLLDDMKEAPWRYTAEVMTYLFNGAPEDVRRRIQERRDIEPRIGFDFIASGLTIDYNRLLEEGIIPDNVTQKDICEPDYTMPQKNLSQLGQFPTGRTDVYFLGVPRSGKSSVLSGIMYELYNEGLAAYEPHFVNGVDPCSSYYSGLIKAMASKKPPVGTPKDSISFMKLNIRNGKRRNEVTIVELSGEAFKGVSEGQENEEARNIWEGLGATQCLKVPNRKCLFFIVDYSVVRQFDGAYCKNIEQAMMLDNALRVFLHDGPDLRKPQVGCTMSKVDTVAIIMTKCDLMKDAHDRNSRLDEAENYIEQNFSTFANNLMAACNRFGINRKNDCRPYILTFSLGDFYVGNTVVFNGEDSEEIIKFISTVTRSVNNDKTSFFGF